jgi:hypothetical protein|tara:strand:- start:2085 stop:3584 length:1500 start_codon:yes stop_codon:yes gene_type:complete
MGYKQNNPLSRKTSPLKHDVLDPRGGVWEHGHKGQDPNVNRGWKNYVDKTAHVTGTAYSPRILRGSTEFGKKPNRASENIVTGTNRMPEELGGKRNTEYNNAMNMATQLAELYNTGQFTGGNFLAEEFYKNPGNLSLKNNKVSWKGGNKGLPVGKSFNVQQGVLGDDGAYTIPENQFTGEQIYEMMNQSGGLVSIVDGIGFVSGNPGQNTVEMPLDENELAGRVQYNAYDPENRDTYDRENIRTHKSNATYDPTTYVPRGYTLAPEPEEEIVTAPITRKSSKGTPFYRKGLKSSPLNQIDPREGEPLEGYTYGEGKVGERVLMTDPVTGVQYWNTPTTFQGSMNVPGIEEVPGVYEPGTPGGEPVNPNPDNLPQEELNRKWTNHCLENPNDPKCQGFNERAGIELEPTIEPTSELLSDVYRTNLREDIPIEEEPEPAPYVDPLNLTGGRTKRGNWSFNLPDLQGMNLGQLRAAGRKSGKSCSKCNRSTWINVLLGRRSG